MLATVDPGLLDRVAFPLGEQDKAADARRGRGRRPRRRRARREPGGVLPRRRRLPRVPRAAGPRAARPGPIVDEDGRRARPPRRRLALSRRGSGAGSASRRPSRSTRSAPMPPPTRSSSGRASALDGHGEVASGPAPPARSQRAEAKLRYRSLRGRRPPSSVDPDGFALGWTSRASAVAPGQVAVLYDDDAIVGAASSSAGDRVGSPRCHRSPQRQATPPTGGLAVFLVAIGLGLGVHALPARAGVRASLVVHPGHGARPAAGDREDRRHCRPRQPRSSTSSTRSPTAPSRWPTASTPPCAPISIAIATPVEKVVGFAAGISHGFSPVPQVEGLPRRRSPQRQGGRARSARPTCTRISQGGRTPMETDRRPRSRPDARAEPDPCPVPSPWRSPTRRAAWTSRPAAYGGPSPGSAAQHSGDRPRRSRHAHDRRAPRGISLASSRSEATCASRRGR